MGWNCDHISCLSSAPLVRKVAQDIECIAFPAKGFQDGFQIEDGGGKIAALIWLLILWLQSQGRCCIDRDGLIRSGRRIGKFHDGL